MKIALASDHAGFALKSRLVARVRALGHETLDIGCHDETPCDYPDFAAFLVQLGIDSISLNPDAVLKTTLKIREMATAQKAPLAAASGT